MSRSAFRSSVIRSDGNNKNPIRSHWERQSHHAHAAQFLHVDNATLHSWRAGAAAIGCTVSELVERTLTLFGTVEEQGNLLEEVLHDRLYHTRAEAEAVAERVEALVVEQQLAGGNAPVTVAEAKQRGQRWVVELDLLGPRGWMLSDRGEDWK